VLDGIRREDFHVNFKLNDADLDVVTSFKNILIYA